MTEQGLTVGRAAALVGVSVKTLHHWDAVGLVRPSGRTSSGYRVYSDEDVARIHRVLVYRELGFSLADIGPLIDDPSVDSHAHLTRQRRELRERVARLRDMETAVERMMAATRGGMQLTAQEQVSIFGSEWNPDWVDQAAARWGDTKQWAQYRERATDRTAEDWRGVAGEHTSINEDFAAAKRAGVAAGSPEANALAERHRGVLGNYFDCTHAMHACIGRQFVAEAGYAEFYDGIEPGLTGWIRDVIFANAVEHGVDPENAVWE
ncbi:MerR family transcriptional regulator [Amycolatopsis benzoatilytica]|uniref:MerR family transcriptional regulator n=1 Tax=Amycolatopsis benzoatilytica TaxID=346045 RepID=UPI001B7F862A|nr:MerR family transcriptional regulator [Amycolatopsis benzoatilytica]